MWQVCLAGHSGAITDLKFNYDGSEIVTTSTDKSVCIWDVATCERVKRIKTHTDMANSVATSRTAAHSIISGSDDCSVRVFDRRKRAGAGVTFTNAPFQVLAVSYGSSDNEVVSAGIDNDIKVWDVRKPGTECLYAMRGHIDSVTGLALNTDGTHIVSNSMDNCLRVWDVRAYVPNGDQRCINILYGHQHNFEKVWDIFKLKSRHKTKWFLNFKNLLRVSWSPDNQLISAGSSDKFLYIWEVESAKIAYKLPGHTGSVNDVDFHPSEPISKWII